VIVVTPRSRQVELVSRHQRSLAVLSPVVLASPCVAPLAAVPSLTPLRFFVQSRHVSNLISHVLELLLFLLVVEFELVKVEHGVRVAILPQRNAESLRIELH